MQLLGAAWLLAMTAAASRPMSTLMLDSIVARRQGIVDSGAASSTLESGFLAQAMEYAVALYPDAKCRYGGYLSAVLDVASADLTSAPVAAKRPLDRFSLATAIRTALASGVAPVTEQARKAYQAIHASLALQERNPDGGLWYFVYPEWSYLDGMFSLLPFTSQLPHANLTDMVLQVNLLRDHCTQRNTSLLFHGYDRSRRAVWADPETGASPYVWGRSLGWFFAALVETWDKLSCQAVQRGDRLTLCTLTKEIAFQLSNSILRYADPATGAWWQIVTLPGAGANYLESSSTALFTFSLLKALRIGLLYGDEPDYKGAALKAYDYTLRHFVTDTGNGTIGFSKTVSVCSLNSTATFEYYTSRPITPNSLLGESAFVLAALEVERLGR
ncbi:Six-hairpin glycosidase [Metarhizium album ARSEF 1941]|uniref:Six-hairpin glycosidase n=1 Tax=Metarhizium album (strain ARSEF 1941) TaxID=1081103 RepID=A0A0B2X805_METAS|nr:Six-hairpin glycosidase [Metarhizium album ARSEF 1941]KHO01888.1 Six-hairpin glycosidase [Metarhizium album ARSEF 1941]